MRTTIYAVLIGAACVAGLLLGRSYYYVPPPEPQPIVIQSQGPTIERLESLARLVTLRIGVADVLVGTGPNCRGAWLIRGDALLAVDLSKTAITEKDETIRRATIRLPLPEVLHARVDHSRTKTWEVKNTSWIPWASEQDRLRDDVMREAQQLVEHAASSSENLQQAKTTTETVIRNFFSELGWNVSVAWTSPDSPAQPEK
jgi:hypothetical protein